MTRKRSAAAQGRDEFRAEETLTVPLREGGTPLWGFVAPVPYEIGMANLGVHEMFHMLRSMGVGAERIFSMPPPHRSLECRRRLSDFPILTASIAYEPDALAFFHMLNREGIPLSFERRVASEGPLIGVGGALCSINPLLFAAVADFVVLGDGEPVLPRLVELVRKASLPRERDSLLQELASMEGVFVPPVHGARMTATAPLSRRRNVAQIGEGALGHSLWITDKAAFGRTFLVELQRGCIRNCPYCTIPHAFSPVRRRPAGEVIRTIEAVAAFGASFSQVGLVTPEAGDYPELSELLDFLESRAWGVSFASLRIDTLSERAIRALVRSGRFSLTLAPEAGNDALRRKCGKPFADETILDKAKMAKDAGVRRLKLYFMIGLPGETDEDVHSISLLAKRIVAETRLEVSLSVGVFVPKPRSRWEKESFIGEREAKRRLRLLGTGLRGGGHCELRHASVQEAAMENALSWVDEAGASILAEAIESGVAVTNALLASVPRFRPEAQSLRIERD